MALHNHDGPDFEKWRYGMVASVLDPAYVATLVATGVLELPD